jgi:hypothetical protein
VSKISEKFYPAEKQPKDWDNVRRISHMLFLAWNNDNPYEGSVYLGEFYTPKPNNPNPTGEFYKFFENFNGYPINYDQKTMFRGYIEGYNYLTFTRRKGVSIFLLTLAAWEAFNGKNVIHFSSNRQLCEMVRRQYDENIDIRFDGKSPPIEFQNINRDTFPLKGIRYQVGLFDNSGLNQFHKNWSHFQPLFENNIHIETIEL